MSNIVVAFLSLAGVAIVLIVVYATLQNRIRNLEKRNRHLSFQSSLFSAIIRDANKKGVAPEKLVNIDKED